MEKTGRKNRKYSTEFKKCVIMDMRERRLSYHKTVRKHWGTKTHSEDCKYINAVKRWERIFLEEGAEGLMKERRGKSYGEKKGVLQNLIKRQKKILLQRTKGTEWRLNT